MKEVWATEEERLNIVVLSDWHVPFHDEKALSVAFAFCKLIQPQIIVTHEVVDCYGLSKFDKNPERIWSLQREINAAKNYFSVLREYCPKSEIYMLESNHLDRIRKVLWRCAPALAGLDELEIENLFAFEKLNIKYQEILIFRNFLFTHGDIIRKHSSYTAKAQFEKEGMNGCSGHTHRLGKYYTTKRGGKYVWIESGCLCDLKPEYIKGTANWQHGLTLVSFKGNTKHFYAMPIPILNDYELNWGDISLHF